MGLLRPPFPLEVVLDWPFDLRRDLRTADLNCSVSGDIVGTANETFARAGYHLASTAAGYFTLSEDVLNRNLRFEFHSVGGHTIDGDTAEVGCTIIDESTTAIAGPFTVQFTLTLNTVTYFIATSTGLTRADIIAGVTASKALVSPPDPFTATAVFSLAFS